MKAVPAHRRVWCLLRARGPLSDNVLERILSGLPGSTVRGARLRLQRAGIVKPIGTTKDGRKKWGLT